MCHPLMESEQEFLYQFFVRNVLPHNELNSNLQHIKILHNHQRQIHIHIIIPLFLMQHIITLYDCISQVFFIILLYA